MPDKKLDLSRPTGTRDFLPREMRKFKAVERVVRDALESFGFEEIQTPTFEFLDLFLIRSGEKFRDDVFTFTQPKNAEADEFPEDSRVFVLRPEFTAPVCRFYIQQDISQEPKPVKIYYVGPCFRYDKPAPGRYREFFQVGVEMFGMNSAACDASTIIVASKIVQRLGIKDYIVRINDLGILRGLLKDYGIEDDGQDKIISIMDKASGDMIKAGLGLIDTTPDTIVSVYIDDLNGLHLDTSLVSILKEMLFLKGRFEAVRDKAGMLFKEGTQAIAALNTSHLGKVQPLLDAAGIDSVVVDLSVARGLDYYTGIVFEIDSPSLGKQKQVCGGGRYDRLIEEFGGEPTPGTGFAFGLDRLVLASEANGGVACSNPEKGFSRADVFIYAFNDALLPEAIKIQDKLIQVGLKVELNVSDWKVGRALQFASKLGFKFAIMIGEKEFKEGKVVLKDMASERQDILPVGDAIERVSRGCT